MLLFFSLDRRGSKSRLLWTTITAARQVQVRPDGQCLTASHDLATSLWNHVADVVSIPGEEARYPVGKPNATEPKR